MVLNRGALKIHVIYIYICNMIIIYIYVCVQPQDGFWFSIVVLSTVGFGDIFPRKFLGRLSTVIWILATEKNTHARARAHTHTHTHTHLHHIVQRKFLGPVAWQLPARTQAHARAHQRARARRTPPRRRTRRSVLDRNRGRPAGC